MRDDARRSERAQSAMLKADGVERVYRDWSLLMRQRRAGQGDEIVVTDLWVVADSKQRTVKGGMRKSVLDRRAEVRRLGASIFELSSRRSTLHEDEADAMLADALDALANTRAKSKRIGRPAAVWTDAEAALVRLHWLSREHSNDRAALAAIRGAGIRGAYYQRVRSAFGPSGRKPGTSGPKPKLRRKRGVNLRRGRHVQDLRRGSGCDAADRRGRNGRRVGTIFAGICCVGRRPTQRQ